MQYRLDDRLGHWRSALHDDVGSAMGPGMRKESDEST